MGGDYHRGAGRWPVQPNRMWWAPFDRVGVDPSRRNEARTQVLSNKRPAHAVASSDVWTRPLDAATAEAQGYPSQRRREARSPSGDHHYQHQQPHHHHHHNHHMQRLMMGPPRHSRRIVEAPSPPCPVHRAPCVSSPPAWVTLPAKGPATWDLCCFCFEVLVAHLQQRPPPPFPRSGDPLFEAPVFITWLKRRRTGAGELELRGCIGCLDPVSFGSGLPEYSIRSSMHDRRFPPVQLEEVPSLMCKLSILYKFEPCSHVFDWQVGQHGVLINFQDNTGRHYSATYLPEVASEHGMTRHVAIQELVAKAGYVGQVDEELLDRIQATRYQTVVEAVTYWEFLGVCGVEAPVVTAPLTSAPPALPAPQLLPGQTCDSA